MCIFFNFFQTIYNNKIIFFRLNLTTEEMKNNLLDDMRRPVYSTVEYPYHPKIINSSSMTILPNSGAVNLFNCIQIFYEFVQRVMKQSFNPEFLFDIEEVIIREIPDEKVSYLISVLYPTPNGIQLLSNENINLFWGDTKIEDVVVPPVLLKNMTNRDIFKRRAVYVVVINLHKLNLLDSSNEPTVEALDKCHLACPPFLMENKMKLSHKYTNLK